MFFKGMDHYIVPSEGITNMIKRFFRMNKIKEACKEYEIPFEKVEKNLNEMKKNMPGKNLAVIFSAKNDGSITFVIEDQGVFYRRLFPEM